MILLPELVANPAPIVICVNPVIHWRLLPFVPKYCPVVPTPTFNSDIVIEFSGKSNLPPLLTNVTPVPATNSASVPNIIFSTCNPSEVAFNVTGLTPTRVTLSENCKTPFVSVINADPKSNSSVCTLLHTMLFVPMVYVDVANGIIFSGTAINDTSNFIFLLPELLPVVIPIPVPAIICNSRELSIDIAGWPLTVIVVR